MTCLAVPVVFALVLVLSAEQGRAEVDNTCWPLEACTTCPGCCRPYLDDKTACNSCVAAECNPSGFQGVKWLFSANTCKTDCGCCSSWSAPIVQAVYPASGNTTLAPGNKLGGLNQALVWNADSTGGLVASTILLNTTTVGNGCAPPMLIEMSFSAYTNPDGSLKYDLHWAPASSGFPCFPNITQVFGSNSFPLLFLEWVNVR